MTAPDDVSPTAVSLHARRDILVAAWEEDAVLDFLRFMSKEHGGTDRYWLEVVACEAKRGTLTAYRYGSGEAVFVAIDATRLTPQNIGSYDKDTVYLSRTDTTLPEIQSLPPPAADSSQWIIGLWGKRPGDRDR